MKLNKNDYIAILNYYNISSKNLSASVLKERSEKILATKLCRCIKKVDPEIKDKPRAVAICNNSVLNKKNLKGPRFTCKRGYKFIKNKNGSSVTKRGKKLTVRKRKQTKRNN
mgnify:CR=1 FL=1|tara:strand:+ start:3629 stop:3964 length:336 start_codon:yes stop_codon:yes gene_type:complete